MKRALFAILALLALLIIPAGASFAQDSGSDDTPPPAPKVEVVYDSGINVDKTAALPNITALQKHYSVPGTNKIVMWNGHSFEVLAARFVDRDSNMAIALYPAQVEGETYVPPPSEYYMHLYSPLDEHTDEKDWQGAIKAKLNKAGTAWVPEHANKNWHRDYEWALQSAVTTAFQSEINLITQTVLTAMAIDHQQTILSNRLQLSRLNTLHNNVKHQVLQTAKDITLGHVQQNPEDSHVHAVVKKAFDLTISAWEEHKAPPRH